MISKIQSYLKRIFWLIVGGRVYRYAFRRKMLFHSSLLGHGSSLWNSLYLVYLPNPAPSSGFNQQSLSLKSSRDSLSWVRHSVLSCPLCFGVTSFIRWITLLHGFVFVSLTFVCKNQEGGFWYQKCLDLNLSEGFQQTKQEESPWVGCWKMSKNCPGGERRFPVNNKCKSVEVTEKHTFPILNHF